MAKDPICGMEIDEPIAAGTVSYKGQTYYFCAPGCLQEFAEDPEKYLAGETISKSGTDVRATRADTGDSE